jgi:hypothetical protein
MDAESGYFSAMTPRLVIAEMLRALAVLALLFLNFAHAPLNAAPTGAGYVAYAADGVCGDLPGDGPTAHAPCHACRIGGGADLPPPCGLPAPAFTAVAVEFGAMAVADAATVPLLAAAPRGPPAA